MAKVFYAAICFVFLSRAFAAMSAEDCGLYELKGIIEKNSKDIGYLYIINQGSKSQYSFTITPELEPKIVPYINRPSKIRAGFNTKIDKYRGEFSSIDSISLVAADPLGLSKENSLVLISRAECAK
jgi:hypothetical protein